MVKICLAFFIIFGIFFILLFPVIHFVVSANVLVCDGWGQRERCRRDWSFITDSLRNLVLLSAAK